MQIETRSGGWEAVFRATGVARYFTAAFLLFWLCGWAAGEIAVGWLLVWIATKGFTEGVPNAPSLAAGLGITAFLLIWFSGWTLGGLAAFRELLRAIAGSDRIGVVRGRLRVQHRAGPARWGRALDPSELEKLELRRKDGALVATVKGGREVLLTSLGSHDERAELLSRLLSELKLSEAGALTPAPVAHAPDGWEADLSPDLEVILRPASSTRRAQGGCLSLLSLVPAGLAAAVVADRATEGWSGGALLAAGVTGALALLGGWNAARLLLGREEWRFRDGTAEFFRAFAGRERRERFLDAALLVSSNVDSDGDEHLTVTVQSSRAQRKLTSSIGPAALRVAEWVAAHGRLRLPPPPRRRDEP